MKSKPLIIGLLLSIVSTSVEGAAVDYKLNQIPENFNQDNNKVETDASDCVDLQLQRNHQQLSLLNATEGTVDVQITFDENVMTADCAEVIAAFNIDRLSSGPHSNSTYKFGRSYQCSAGVASSKQCTYTCDCTEDPCQVITLIGAGTKAQTESETWRICKVDVTQ